MTKYRGPIVSGTNWKSFTLGTEPAGWKIVGFDDSAWEDTVATGGVSGIPGMRPEHAYIPGESLLYRREFYVEAAWLTGPDVTLQYAFDNAGTVYVNGVQIAQLTGTANSNWSTDHATTIPLSTFRAGWNCIAISTTDDGNSATHAILRVGIEVNEGQGYSSEVTRCDHHHRARDIWEDVDLNSQAAFVEVRGELADHETRIDALEASPAPAVTVQEADGSPTVANVTTIKVSNGDLTDEGGGVVSIKTAADATGAGAVAQAYVGKNGIGASREAMTSRRVYAKKVTLANACLVTNIEAYVDGATAESKVDNLSVAIYSDSSGTPDSIIAYNVNPTSSVALDDTNGAGGNNVGRWLRVPIGKWLTAGDYWIAVASLDATTEGQRIAYDTSGTDRYYLPGGDWFVDWGFNTPTTGTRDYSIRANTIR